MRKYTELEDKLRKHTEATAKLRLVVERRMKGHRYKMYKAKSTLKLNKPQFLYFNLTIGPIWLIVKDNRTEVVLSTKIYV